MTDRLRILIEVNGEAWMDADLVVARVRLNKQNDIREKPVTGANKEWELTGGHSIQIDYKDVLA